MSAIPEPKLPDYLERLYPLQEMAAWEELRTHLAFAEGFSYAVILAPDDLAVAYLRQRTTTDLVKSGIHRIVLEAGQSDGWLAEQVLLIHSEKSEIGMIWIDAEPTSAEQFESRDRTWANNWSRLNRYRNTVMKQWQKPLVVAGPFRMQQVVRNAAPDFWRLAKMFRFEISQSSQLAGRLPPFEDMTDSSKYDFGLGGDPEQTLSEVEKLSGLPGREMLVAELLSRAARQYYQHLQFDLAIANFEEAIRINEIYGGDPDFSWELHMFLGMVFKNISDFQRSKYHLDESLAIASKSPFQKGLSDSLSNLAGLLFDMKRLKEAEQLTRRALALYEERLGANHPQIAIALNNLSMLLGEMDRLSEAELIIRRALAIDRNHYGENHPAVARGLNNLALVFRATERRQDAQELLRRALAIDEAGYGENHPNIARDLTNLGLLLLEENRYTEAEKLLWRALHILSFFKSKAHTEHPRWKSALNNYRHLLEKMNLSGPEIAAKIAEFDRSEGVV